MPVTFFSQFEFCHETKALLATQMQNGFDCIVRVMTFEIYITQKILFFKNEKKQ